MPELPEVETVMRALKRFVEGRAVTGIKTHIAKLRYPIDFSALDGTFPNRIEEIRRRAKYMIVVLDNAHGLLIHLGMTGSFRLESIRTERQKHDHVEFFLEGDEVLRYNDPRRFGFIQVVDLPDSAGEPAELPKLAPEPLTSAFDVAWLRNVCQRSKKPVKNLIMDNAMVVGVGNIYASEALFRAGIRPSRPANSLNPQRITRLHRAIIEVLQEAIEAGGTTIINFTSINSQEGYFARQLNVYNRAGKTCLKCGRARIRRTVMAGRSTFFCAVCQR